MQQEIKMTMNRAYYILDPENREHCFSMEEVEEATRTIRELEHQLLKRSIQFTFCFDCKYWNRDTNQTCRLWGGASQKLEFDYCSRAEQRDGKWWNDTAQR